MLTRYLKDLLDNLISHTSTPNSLYVVTSTATFNEYLSGDSDLSVSEKADVTDSIRYLNKIGYIRFQTSDVSSYAPFCLTYEGRHYKSFSRLRTKQFIMESIFTPIVISAITTIIGLLLAGII